MVGLRLGNKGAEVEYIQSTLHKTGDYKGYIYGEYDKNTLSSVKSFQKTNELPQTGYIDKETLGLLSYYMRGYMEYTVSDQDTLASISKKLSSSPLLLISANPTINPFFLQKGQRLTIPFDYQCTYDDISYTYDVLENNITGLKKRYPFIDISIIGKSVENRNIYAIKLGKGDRKVFINGGTHACEWITVPLLMKWIEEVCHIYVCDGMVYGRYIQELFKYSTIYIVPMVNPDGIELQIKGISPNSSRYMELVMWNNGKQDFSKWKANIMGVDLNRNYDARWDEYKRVEKESDIAGPWFELYSGPYPESEPETYAIANYTRQEKFDMVLSYHTQGEVIYWDFEDMSSIQAKEMALRLSKASGYYLDIPARNASYAGYKDWFIKEFKKPGYTIECGYGENPLPIMQLNKIYNDNFELLFIAAWGH